MYHYVIMSYLNSDKIEGLMSVSATNNFAAHEEALRLTRSNLNLPITQHINTKTLFRSSELASREYFLAELRAGMADKK